MLKPTKQQAFTLVEILVVIFMMGIVFSMIAIKFSHHANEEYQLKSFSRELTIMLKIAQQDATTKATLYRFKLDDQVYGIQKWGITQENQAPRWIWDSKDRLLTAKKKPHHIQIHIHKGKTKHLDFSDGHNIEFYPSGEISPFELILSTDKTSKSIIITGNNNGSIYIQEQSNSKNQ